MAMRPTAPKQPFGLPDSVRPLNPMRPLGDPWDFFNVDPNGNPIVPPLTNAMYNFGWEYVWHCHILSHEEMDMMRPMGSTWRARCPSHRSYRCWPVARPFLPGRMARRRAAPATLGNPANEIGFRIERAVNGGAFSAIGTALANATSISDGAVSPGSDYAWRVVAFNVAGETPSNVVAWVSTPNDPTGLLAAAPFATQVNLTWTDNSLNETAFQIWRATGGGALALLTTVGSNTTSFSDMTVVATTTYSYQIIAVNSAGSSGPSNLAVITTPGALPPPAAPSNLTATLLGAPLRVRLIFRDNATTESGFVIERADNGGPFVPIGAPGPRLNTGSVTYIDNTVAIGNTYDYRVKAVRPGASSAYSNVVDVDVLLPAAPTNVNVTAVNNGANALVTLTWTDNSNNETGFRIQRATNATFTAGLSTSNVGANVTTFQQTRPHLGTYYYRVAAVNSITGLSAWVNATPFPIITP